ncbi:MULTISPECIES: hypothetical protein [unclassified Sphingomonas]|uniref:hypothetical protein n=1 Tax=unclassified Sphingomonas TaxID=196159 RepID=UPI0006F96C20|nr:MULTISPECIES: hypothetical protein [unclassified Sphingomonas]KQX17671.1 hypothetical protein ASD17_18260 [Sphingomonas sp. Root1294]KQY70597.1 hypothetical protein ASD39_22160 [Sphingomonas sp. Root50]KRB91912.1 hypothetical protein ASE22_08150 [Sphingomonas sp. Root720]
MIRLSLTIALMSIPAALAAQGLPVDFDAEATQPPETSAAVATPPAAVEIDTVPPRPRTVRYSPVKIRLQDGTPAPIYVAAGAGVR